MYRFILIVIAFAMIMALPEPYETVLSYVFLASLLFLYRPLRRWLYQYLLNDRARSLLDKFKRHLLDKIEKSANTPELKKRLEKVGPVRFVEGILAGGLVVITFFSFMAFSGGSNPATTLDTHREVATRFASEDAIRQQLKFPSTARFSEREYRQLNDNEYFYTALVRAENSLGNKVPSYWHVVLAFQPGTANVSQIISVTQTQ